MTKTGTKKGQALQNFVCSLNRRKTPTSGDLMHFKLFLVREPRPNLASMRVGGEVDDRRVGTRRLNWQEKFACNLGGPAGRSSRWETGSG